MSKPVAQRAPKRPIDKTILSVDLLGSTSQSNLILRTAEVAETFSGGNINLSAVKVAQSSRDSMTLVIVLQRDGNALNSVSLTHGAKTYTPEENVLWSRVFAFPGVSLAEMGYITADRIKTQRKLRVGDKLVLLTKALVVNSINITGNFTGFFKQ